MKQSAQKRIIIWSIVSAVLIFILVAGFVVNAHGRLVPSLDDKLFGSNFNTDYDTTYEKTNRLKYISKDLSDINIYLSNGKVIFKESNSDYIEISQLKSSSADESDYSNEFYYKYGDSALNLYGSEADFNLKEQDFSSYYLTLAFDNLFSDVPDKTIVVKIPKNAYLNNINIFTASAGIDFENTDADCISINSYSGYINARLVNSINLQIQNVSGDINLNQITADELSIHSVAGEVSAEGDIQTAAFDSVSGNFNYYTDSLTTNSISITTVSGDAYIVLPKTCGFTAQKSSVSGNLYSGFNVKKIDDRYIYGSGGTDIYFDSVSGSINIHPIKK